MKKSMFVLVMMAAMFMASQNMYAQRRPAMRANAPVDNLDRRVPGGGPDDCRFISDLSEDQQEKMAELRSRQLESGIQHRNQMAELSARKRTLMTQSNPNMTEINSVIDQMEKLRTQRQKESAAHIQQVRSLLTDEQRLQFDARGGRGAAGKGRHMPAGRRFGR